MSITQDTPRITPDLPPGVRPHEVVGFADSWLAFDQLAEQDGWERHEKHSDWTSHPVVWKQRLAGGVMVIVHAPLRVPGLVL